MKAEHEEFQKIYVKIINKKIKKHDETCNMEIVSSGSGIEVHLNGVQIPTSDVEVSAVLSMAHKETEAEISQQISELFNKLK